MNQSVAQATRTANHVPLAQRLRPKTLGDVIGQDHLLGEGLPLRLALRAVSRTAAFCGVPRV